MEVIESAQSLWLEFEYPKDGLKMKNLDDNQGETTDLGRKFGSLNFRSQGKEVFR